VEIKTRKKWVMFMCVSIEFGDEDDDGGEIKKN